MKEGDHEKRKRDQGRTQLQLHERITMRRNDNEKADVAKTRTKQYVCRKMERERREECEWVSERERDRERTNARVIEKPMALEFEARGKWVEPNEAKAQQGENTQATQDQAIDTKRTQTRTRE